MKNETAHKTKVCHDVRCPACQKKLMKVNTKSTIPPIVQVQLVKKELEHTIEARCDRCKVFVSID